MNESQTPKNISLPAVIITSGWLLSILYSLDPQGNSWGAIEYPLLKYMPSILSFGAFSGLFLIKGKLKWRWTLENGALFIFMLFILAGSSFALVFKNSPLSATFMGVGINSISYFAGYYFFSFSHPKTREKTWGWLTAMTIIASIWIIFASILRTFGLGFTQVTTLYHEEFFLVPCAILFLANTKKVYTTLGLAVLAAVSGALSAKITGFLVSALVSGYLFWTIWEIGKLKKFFILRIFLLWLVGIIFAVIISIILQMPSVLPTGSPGLRLTTYHLRLNEFFESPILGQAFTGAAELILPTRDGFVVLPSHSDLLDIASQGGILGLILFLIPVYRIGARFTPLFLSNRFSLQPYAKFSLILALSFFSMLVFNPVLKQPGLSYFFWISMGYLASLKKEAAGR